MPESRSIQLEQWAQQTHVEVLFQTKSVAEVREVEARARHDIEEKKKQLRQVVGDSYRDLISSADTIVGIHTQCGRLVELLGSLDRGVGAVAADVERRHGSAHGAEAASSYDKLFALGSRIKYLIDTPETIYGCLDAARFLEAAQRYVRAAEVHRAFAARHRHAASRFPLLRHQWPLVKELGSEAWERAAGWLAAQGGATPAQLAGALAALALLRPIDGAEALKQYLASRRRYLLGCLAAAAAGADGGAPPGPDALAAVLSDAVALVCTTVAQCGEIFLSRPGVYPEPLLLATAARRDPAASELLFDPGTAAAGDSPEAAAWGALQSAACERLASLSAAGVALECSQWLEALAAQCAPLCSTLLAACASAADLAKVEGAVRRALRGWCYTLAPPEADAAAAASEVLAWSDTCQWVTGRPAPLWALLMERPVLGRAKELVAADFAAVPREAGALLAAAAAAAAALPPSAPGSFDPGNWGDAIVLQPATPGGAEGGPSARVKRRRSSRGSAAADATGAGGGDARGWLPRAEAVLQAVDRQLERALSAALDASQSEPAEQQQQQQGGAAYGSAAAAAAAARRGGHGAGDGSSGRALVLEPYVQERCVEAVEAVAAQLGDTLRALGSPAGGAPAAHAALLVGRVALGIAGRSAPLRLLLGPPAQWRLARPAAALGAPPVARRGSEPGAAGAAGGPPPRLDALQLRLHAVSAEAYGAWASWAAQGLAQRLVAELAADQARGPEAALRGWEETAVAGPDGSGDDVCFMLPAAPSPAAMRAALGACAEIDRAGGHLLEERPLRQLRWRVGGEVGGALRAALAPGGALSGTTAASEKGALQLLFDVRFLSVLLAGAPPAGEAPGAAAARRREAAELEAELSGLMDPIDWATYESHLYANVGRFAARCRVLLGALGHGAAARADAAGGGAGSGAGAAAQPADSNVLRLAPAGPRFTYLPVNTPPALRQRPPQQGALDAMVALRRGGGGLAAAAPHGDSYSFASLTTGRGASRRAAAQEQADGAAGSAAAVGAAAFEALRSSRFGSLLGDKAAEVSASLAAGEYSFSNLSAGGAGLLSTLASFKK